MRFLPVLALLCLLATSACLGQTSEEFGIIPPADKNLSAYAKDPTAPAVVLYEKGDNYFEVIKDYILLVKKYHVRIKILDDKGLDEGTVAIPYYHSEGNTEKVENIRAVTHNGDAKTFVLPKDIFTKDLSDRVSAISFTFPNLKPGSILEYEYKLVSPYIFKFNGWSFQSHLPKRYSEFNAKIPGNYSYNRNLTGSLPLDVNEARLVRECFKVEGTPRAADCEVLRYVMKDVPAFKKEAYMLASSNYISRIDFELAEHHRLDGVTHRYTKSWKAVDDELRNNRDLGVQLNKKGYFERHVPDSLLTEGDPLYRAMRIYKFVRDHYTWTGEFGIYNNTRVKEAFEARKGNIGEINISLINLLNAAGIPTQMMLSSTRDHGLPKRSHPVMSDFNYVLARTTIDGKVYLLDASDRSIPFGMLPFHCLNYYGRVMDFKDGSYWEDIVAAEPFRRMVRAQLAFAPGMADSQGVLDEITMGYGAVARRETLKEQPGQAYLSAKEQEMGNQFAITNYSLNSPPDDENRISERFEFRISPQWHRGKLYFNPFLLAFLEQNPFTLAERHYPVDFGHASVYSYTISLLVPEGYAVEKMPSPLQITMAEQLGSLKFDVSQAGNNITLMFNLVFSRPHIPATYYRELKTFYNTVIDLQKNALIVIAKNAGSE